MRPLAGLAAFLLLLGGCASASRSATSGPRSALRVTYHPHGLNGGGTRVWQLTCAPAGGSHPRARTACHELAAHGALLGPPKAPCTRGATRLGAPESLVSGHIGRRRVERLLRPACDAAAWSALHALLTGR